MRFLKKAISLLASSFLVLILSGFLSLRPIANPPALAAVIFPNNACRDITKAAAKNFTDPVPAPLAAGRKEGVADSGQMDFDQPADFQACVSTDQATRTLAVQMQDKTVWEGEVTGQFLKGWVWNTNLGDISFSCENGMNGEGAACGDVNDANYVDYGVYLKGTELRGFAYGDKTGWISMGCRNQKNLVPADLLAAGNECGAKAYGVYAASAEQVGQTEDDCEIASAGDLYGYAWTESVGWINFCGSHLDVTPSGISLAVDFEAKPSGGGGAGGGDAGADAEVEGENVYANGIDSYKIIIKATENGASLDQAAYTTHEIAVSVLEWTNTLRADQVTTCAGAACVYNGAILPATPDGFAYDAAEQALVGEVKAIAPTLGADTLKLNEITVTVDGIGQMLTPPGGTYNFIFKPAVAVSRILGADAAGNLVPNDITALNNTPQEVRIIAKKTEINADAIRLVSQLYNCSDGQYEFVFDDGQGNVKNEAGTAIDENQFIPPESLGTFPNIQRQGICVGLEPDEQKLDDAYTKEILFAQDGTAEIQTFIFAAPPEGGAPEFETTDALALQPIIVYKLNDIPVRYFSPEQPLRAGVLNQAASVTGNVNISIVNTEGLRSDISKSLGDRARSRREAYYRAVKVVLGQRAPDAFDAVGSDEKNLTADNAFSNKDILYYVRPQGQIPEKPCKVIINNITLTGNKTLVTDGCDIFIDSNINPQNASLGIIAMEDMTKANEPKGGNIYICNGVTDIKTHIIADGSILSYGNDPTNNICQTKDNSVINQDTGMPIYSGVRVLLKNQLAIEGSIMTNNTYGGSLRNPMLTCNGERADTDDEKRAARYCDINFLRYAKTEPNPDDPTGLCWADDIGKSELAGGNDCATNFPRTGNTGKGIVNIIYKTPSKDLPIFNKVK